MRTRTIKVVNGKSFLLAARISNGNLWLNPIKVAPRKKSLWS